MVKGQLEFYSVVSLPSLDLNCCWLTLFPMLCFAFSLSQGTQAWLPDEEQGWVLMKLASIEKRGTLVFRREDTNVSFPFFLLCFFPSFPELITFVRWCSVLE